MEKNVFEAQCPSRDVLQRVASKWPALIICALAGRTLRYGELQKMISGLSQKMLTQTLRELEQDGLIAREAFAEVPPRVEYTLTPLGKSLHRPLLSLCQWAETHCSELATVGRKSRSK